MGVGSDACMTTGQREQHYTAGFGGQDRRKLNLPIWPTTGMAQTGRLTDPFWILRVFAILGGFVAAFWGVLRLKMQ